MSIGNLVAEELFALLGGALVTDDCGGGKPFVEFIYPVGECGEWDDDEVWS